MIAIYLSPLYVVVNVYILYWIIHWLTACHGIFRKKILRVAVCFLYSVIALSILVGFFGLPGEAKRTVKLLGNYWLGILEYTVIVVGIACLIRRILLIWSRIDSKKLGRRRVRIMSGAICFCIIVGLASYGMIHARHIYRTPYEVTVEKSAGDIKNLKIVLVSDIHMGYNIGVDHVSRMVDMINDEDADLVVIAGDLFDNEYDALEDDEKLIELFRSIKSRYGVYACYGNHDVNEKVLAGFTFGGGSKKVSDPRMDTFMEMARIKLLRDETVLVADSFYLCGRADSQKPGRGIEERKTPEELFEGLDMDKPVIVIDHEPSELQELADAGADVDLGGHTHDGQIFPVNILTDIIWENSYGYLKKDGMHSIVSSGVGVFGPNMRVGTIAEICPVTIHFQ